jgi:hypothetical protein
MIQEMLIINSTYFKNHFHKYLAEIQCNSFCHINRWFPAINCQIDIRPMVIQGQLIYIKVVCICLLACVPRCILSCLLRGDS